MADRQAPTGKAWLVTALARGLVLGAVLAVAAEAARMLADDNEHVVVPGRVYRSSQPRSGRLSRLARQRGIRTVVSLRGAGSAPWAVAEATETQMLGLSQETITLSATHPPAPGEIRRLVEVFDRAEYPLLIHCQSGADRTGLAAVVYLLLHTDASLDVARRQMSVRYGHVGVGVAHAPDEFLAQYEAWLGARGEGHTPAAFRRWATAEYAPALQHVRLQLLDAPVATVVGRAVVVTVRAHNISLEPWPFRAGTRAGVHAVYVVHGPGQTDWFTGRAGLFDRSVRPGESVDLALPVPPAAVPGRHRLTVDLYLGHVSFGQCGCTPLTVEWEATVPGTPGGRR